jgi:DNA-binding transcriptional LysR family regulator
MVAMELRHFRYFVAVAEELHFSRAAARLNIATPTLSHQIQSLESILGAQLFTRKTRSAVVLTRAGKRFLDEARATLKQADHAASVVRRAARGEVGNLAIGYLFAASCTGLLSAAITGFRAGHPDVSFQLRKLEPFTLYEAVADGEIDVAFTRAADRYPAGLSGFVVLRLPLYLAMPQGHRLAARTQISPDLLDDEEYVSTSVAMEVGLWGNIAGVMAKTASPRIVARADDVFSVLTLVSAGVGISIVSEAMLRLAIPGVVFRRLSGIAQEAEFAVVYRRNEDAPVVKAFIQMLRTQAKAGERPEKLSAPGSALARLRPNG